MTMHITPTPMSVGAFDHALAALGWRRDADEASDAAGARIGDIDVVPAADGSNRIMFDARVRGSDRLVRALRAVPESDPSFWSTLGIDIEPDERAN